MAINFNGEGFNFNIDETRLLNAPQDTSGTPTFEHYVRPEFNYIAKQFNDSYSNLQETYMPTPYSEVEQRSPIHEEVYSVPGFNILVGGNIDSGNEDSQTNPRRIFLSYGNPKAEYTINSRDPQYIDEFQNIVLTDSLMINTANSTVRSNSESRYFPQYVEVSLAGPGLSANYATFNSNVPSIRQQLANINMYYDIISDFVNDPPESQEFDLGQGTTEGWLFFDLSDTGASLVQRPVDTADENYWTHIGPISEEVYNGDKVEKYNILKDILANMLAYSGNQPGFTHKEYLFFEIQKHIVGGEKVQTFWVYNNGQNRVTFFDTQVKIGVAYRYEFYAYVVAGRNASGGQVNEAQVKPEFWLFKIPMFEQLCKIEQPSLPTPQVEFSNLKDSSNKIKIRLNLSANSENPPEFIGLYDNEKALFDNRYNLYDITREKNKFVYETQPGKFQMFKMEAQPEQASEGNPYINIPNISTLTAFQAANGGTLATFTDFIAPFKKYYYVFRAINTYGYPSNPTPVWEVELTKDANETFLHANVVGFAKPNQDKYKLEKTMSRLLQVVPSLNQATFDKTGISDLSAYSDNDPLPTLGIVEEKMWFTTGPDGAETSNGKKFKIRLTSRETGRKLDLNLKFILNKNHNN